MIDSDKIKIILFADKLPDLFPFVINYIDFYMMIGRNEQMVPFPYNKFFELKEEFIMNYSQMSRGELWRTAHNFGYTSKSQIYKGTDEELINHMATTSAELNMR